MSNRTPQNIHLTASIRGMKPSATVAINDRSNALRARGREIFKLGLGQSPFPVPESVTQSLRDNAFQKDYLPVCGLQALRRTVAEHHCRTFDIDAHQDNVLIGPGSKELMFLLQLVYDGDIVIQSPSWVSYAPQARIVGRRRVSLDTSFRTRWFATADQLEALCRKDPSQPRILILNYPSNPTGLTMPPDQLAGIADVARRYGVVVLSDEIYGKTQHDGVHHSIVPMYPEGTIFSGGLSKWCGAGGWRLGLFVFPDGLDWLLDAMAAVATETFTSTSAPIQYAAVRAFEEGADIDDYLLHSRRVLRCLGRLLTDRLAAAGAHIHRPDGAFYLFPNFSDLAESLREKEIHTSAEMCERLLEETGVAVLPGVVFQRPAKELSMRIAYVDFDGAAALAASRREPLEHELDAAFAARTCPRVVEAVNRICAWVAG